MRQTQPWTEDMRDDLYIMIGIGLIGGLFLVVTFYGINLWGGVISAVSFFGFVTMMCNIPDRLFDMNGVMLMSGRHPIEHAAVMLTVLASFYIPITTVLVLCAPMTIVA